MVVTVLEAQVSPGKADALQQAFQDAVAGTVPPGLVHTELLQDARDPSHWRIETSWASREALDAMRSSGTPAGVLMFRAADAEPTLSIFTVVNALADQQTLK